MSGCYQWKTRRRRTFLSDSITDLNNPASAGVAVAIIIELHRTDGKKEKRNNHVYGETVSVKARENNFSG